MPRSRSVDAVAGTLANQGGAVDEQVRVVDARRRSARHPLGHRHGEEPCQRGRGDRVDQQQPAWSQQPARLLDRRRRDP